MENAGNANGRLFNHTSENQLFGFWGNQVGSIWLNAILKITHKDTDSKRKFMVLRNNNDRKEAWMNGSQYVTSSTLGDNSWGGTVSVGRNTVVTENASGYLYEVICFNKALSDNEVNTITDELKVYYPFV